MLLKVEVEDRDFSSHDHVDSLSHKFAATNASAAKATAQAKRVVIRGRRGR